MSRTLVGIVAEDESDVVVVQELVSKWSDKLGFRSFKARGSGKLRRNARAWVEDLEAKGCRHIFVVHDCDHYNPDELRRDLDNLVCAAANRRRVIVIPVREIEAWLLADSDAIRAGCNLKSRPPDIPNTESETDPKRKLGTIISQRTERRRDYVSTIDNPRIARHLQIAALMRCGSFACLAEYLDNVFRKNLRGVTH